MNPLWLVLLSKRCVSILLICIYEKNRDISIDLAIAIIARRDNFCKFDLKFCPLTL